jgi:hypothetical protein
MKIIMKNSFITLILICAVSSSFSEFRVWNFNNGKSIEAEFVTLLGGQVSLKTVKGKRIKIPENQFSDEDRVFLELINPPKLDLSLSKSSKVRVFPESLSDLPSAQYYNFAAVIAQKSPKNYQHELTAELFVIGEEKSGDNKILLDYKKSSFKLMEGSKSVFKLPSKTVELTQFASSNGQMRGEEYDGYMIIVMDSRGEILASKSTRDDWLLIADNLRKLPIGKYFDKEGNRAWPTRPKRFY